MRHREACAVLGYRVAFRDPGGVIRPGVLRAVEQRPGREARAEVESGTAVEVVGVRALLAYWQPLGFAGEGEWRKPDGEWARIMGLGGTT